VEAFADRLGADAADAIALGGTRRHTPSPPPPPRAREQTRAEHSRCSVLRRANARRYGHEYVGALVALRAGLVAWGARLAPAEAGAAGLPAAEAAALRVEAELLAAVSAVRQPASPCRFSVNWRYHPNDGVGQLVVWRQPCQASCP
jgi:hypothetical protein